VTHGQSQSGGTWSLNYLVFGILGLVVLIFLMYGMFNKALLPSLASISVSRGLITFLIAVVTVIIALILVLATVVSDNPDLANRFMQGKEVLTMLIGVLGTIVGFYFGNADDGKKPLAIAAPVVSNESPVAGGKIDLTTFISAGRPPYSFEVLFTPKNVIPDQQGRSETGWIQLRDLAINSTFVGGAVSYEIVVHDAEGKTETRSGSLKVAPRP
jgi:hypothetical protein